MTDLLTRYEIPYLHPLAVHFPIVLLLLGAAVAVLYAALGRAVWRLAALALFTLGAAGAFAARQTGGDILESVAGSPVVDAVVRAHIQASDYTMWTATAAALGFAALSAVVRRRGAPASGEREPLAWRLALLVPAIAAALLVAYTGHLGGIMVYGVPAG